MNRLTVAPNLPRPDEAYAGLLAAHDGLDAAQSAALNARLVLILANHIGDAGVLEEAVVLARRAARPARPAP